MHLARAGRLVRDVTRGMALTGEGDRPRNDHDPGSICLSRSRLQSCYPRRCRADTNIVANWLATTAKAHRYEGLCNSSARNGASAKSKCKRKGKGKRQNRPAAPTPPLNTNTTAKKQHVLEIRDFEPLAAHLAKAQVPDYFAVAIERVIWGAFECDDLLPPGSSRVLG